MTIGIAAADFYQPGGVFVGGWGMGYIVILLYWRVAGVPDCQYQNCQQTENEW
ncbi:MAG: hypothetical protein J5I98_13635 [Phaeodactylibacter sp.]|nr:hypothetical protein [Phaeodactylibacter sp.]